MYVDINLKPGVLIENGYYIVPSPSTALAQIKLYSFILLDGATLTLLGSSEGDNSGYGCVLRLCSTVEYIYDGCNGTLSLPQFDLTPF